MKPKLLHQQAMELSFEAKQSLVESKFSAAFELYKKAAELESQVAEFYFDKPELEPTRSVIIRSAAFLNLKAGLVEEAQKFIFFGLLNSTDEQIKIQLNNALELAISLKNLDPEIAYGEFNYINLLRQRSVHYILEPNNVVFGHSVSLEMIKDFSEGYLKSLKAYAKSTYKKINQISEDISDSVEGYLEKLVNPLVTQSSYGSFRFSVANDFIPRLGEEKELIDFKANIVSKYHKEIFINPLSDSDINEIKQKYTAYEINEIFRPLTKIKSNNTPYKIGYFDSENLYKSYLSTIVNKQKQKLISVNQLNQDDIGELENAIIHTRSSQDGKISKKTILRQHLKSYEFDIKTNQILPKNHSPLIFNDEILLTVYFNSGNGFMFSFDDFQIKYLDTEYERGLTGFYSVFYEKIIFLVNKEEKSMEEQKDWDVIKKLLGNPDALKTI
jgi:hypothetical protein